MLQDIRDKAQTWVAWVIVIVLSLMFALWGISNYFTNKQSDAVAKVNRVEISKDTFRESYNRARQSWQYQFGQSQPFTDTQSRLLKHAVRNHLIQSEVLKQATNHAGLTVPSDVVETQLLVDPTFQVNGKFSPTRFSRFLAADGYYDENAFVRDLQTQYAIAQLQHGIMESAFTLPYETHMRYRLNHERRDFSYLTFPKDTFAKTITVSPAQLKAYYAAHQAQFTTPEAVKIAYIELSVNALEKQYHFTEADIQKFYQDNITSFMVPPSYQVSGIQLPASDKTDQTFATIQQRQHSGENLAVIAHSIPHATFLQTHWFTTSQDNRPVDIEMLKAASHLKKMHTLSTPFACGQYRCVIQLLTKKAATPEKLSIVKNQIEQLLAQQKAQSDFADLSEQLSDLTYQNSDSLKPAAKALHLGIQQTEFFTATSKLTKGVLAHPAVIKAAFSDDVLAGGNNSDPITIGPGDVIVLRVTEHRAQKQKPFASVESEIKTQAVEAAASAKLNATIADIVKAKNPQTLDTLAQKYHLTLQTEKDIHRTDSHLSPEIIQRVFSLPPQSIQAKTLQSVTLPNGDSALLVLQAIHQASLQDMQTLDKQAYQKQQARMNGTLAFNSFLSHEMETAKITRAKQF